MNEPKRLQGTGKVPEGDGTMRELVTFGSLVAFAWCVAVGTFIFAVVHLARGTE